MTKSESTTRVLNMRKAHHAALHSLALTVGHDEDGLSLWRKLGRLERRIVPIRLDYSNGENGVTLEDWELAKNSAKSELITIFGGTIPKGVYINGDPRGHALKLDCDDAPVPDGMEKDWGGNGILAATID